ncbi:3-hydroxyisobutyrate dehydrogenase [Deinococcus piscis]|uniref:3-hydroxyisobutyrate dehydrogenase n=1 Tax=Deinococcus piscis TaxID=394230 RepID=A0ABQ3K115_9DEIO|nr:NAD(P)-binding domain-containing protein [Deinococcus piscis]GHF97200.1 3-hydroxyisobutyrate dehydrogenase [Deinococcus piscis]
MNIGILGAGNIGGTLAQKLAAQGHSVKLANSRGAASLRDLAARIGVTAADQTDAVKDVEVIIIAVPLANVPQLAELLSHVPKSTVLIDTTNYYPFRDGELPELEAGQPESLWVSEQLGRPVVKAWNAVLAETLRNRGKPAGVAERIALPVAGDDAGGKQIAAQLVHDSGFDALDAGPLTESWRQQPGTPAYCTELTLPQLRTALAAADQQRAPLNRDSAMEHLMVLGRTPTHDEIVQNNRAASA